MVKESVFSVSHRIFKKILASELAIKREEDERQEKLAGLEEVGCLLKKMRDAGIV